jgi:hypothetical protein
MNRRIEVVDKSSMNLRSVILSEASRSPIARGKVEGPAVGSQWHTSSTTSANSLQSHVTL